MRVKSTSAVVFLIKGKNKAGRCGTAIESRPHNFNNNNLSYQVKYRIDYSPIFHYL